MTTVRFDDITPLGARFTIAFGRGSWQATVLHEALLVLPGETPAERFTGNKERLTGIALAKVGLGETFESELIISLADLNRTDLPA